MADLVGVVGQLGGQVAHDAILPHATDSRRSPVTGPASHRGRSAAAAGRTPQTRRTADQQRRPDHDGGPEQLRPGQVLVEQQDTQGDDTTGIT